MGDVEVCDHHRDAMRILVASSDSTLRSLLAWTFSHDDRFRVVGQAAIAEEVLDWPSPFDAAVVDLTIGGLGLLAVIRRLLRRADAPAVVVVGYEKAGYLRAALAEEGAADYLLLPDDVEGLGPRTCMARSGTGRPPVPG